jgi:hypothetical protein
MVPFGDKISKLEQLTLEPRGYSPVHVKPTNDSEASMMAELIGMHDLEFDLAYHLQNRNRPNHAA